MLRNHPLISRRLFALSANRTSSYCTGSDKPVADGETKPKPEDKSDASQATPKKSAKLEALLLSMKRSDGIVSREKFKVELTPPKGREMAKKIREQQRKKTLDEKIQEAAKVVANVVVGDPQKTESELLKRLMQTEEGGPQTTNLTSLVADMKIEKTVAPNPSTSKAERLRGQLRSTARGRPVPIKNRKKIDLFGGKPLGIFTAPREKAEEVSQKSLCSTWDALERKELKMLITHPPRNALEEMIVWTEQGKIWKFPVDNEQDFHEKDVPFEEHVFLDEHLEPWCPEAGPVRNFMELVVLGLSQNPWMTVDYKKKTISWYRDYFASKKPVLESAGVAV